MPRRCNDHLGADEPPKKKPCTPTSSFSLKPGEFLKDIGGKEWKLGKAVGVGGFGEIFLASNHRKQNVEADSSYVAKVESFNNGPLFVEVNCYLRIAKLEMIEEFKRTNKLKDLGMPHYVASGSHICKGERYRFLILPRFDKDLERVLQDRRILNLKSVLMIASQIVDVLWYIHSKGYIHSDIKASNILLKTQSNLNRKLQTITTRPTVCHPVRSCRIKKRLSHLRPQGAVNYIDDILNFEELIGENDIQHGNKIKSCAEGDQVYLLDYGLASKFLNNKGEHKPYCIDMRKAHAGTILFCSRDAHKGVSSRRSDLESLGYNMIYWLTGNLPWAADCEKPELVEKKKLKAMAQPEMFLKICFNGDYPKFLLQYFSSLQKLQFADSPPYDLYKQLFRKTLTEQGYKDHLYFDFDNIQGWGKKQKKIKRKNENMKSPRLVYKISRPPLLSNVHIKPLLRKKNIKKVKKQMHWSKILIDPEIIIRQAREKKSEHFEPPPDLSQLDVQQLNPTPTMLEVYNKSLGRIKSDSCNSDMIEGYTPAMMCIFKKIREQKLQEDMAVNAERNVRSKRPTRPRKYESSLKTISHGRSNNKVNTVVKKDNLQNQKLKASSSRTYALRG